MLNTCDEKCVSELYASIAHSISTPRHTSWHTTHSVRRSFCTVVIDTLHITFSYVHVSAFFITEQHQQSIISRYCIWQYTTLQICESHSRLQRCIHLTHLRDNRQESVSLYAWWAQHNQGSSFSQAGQGTRLLGGIFHREDGGDWEKEKIQHGSKGGFQGEGYPCSCSSIASLPPSIWSLVTGSVRLLLWSLSHTHTIYYCLITMFIRIL